MIKRLIHHRILKFIHVSKNPSLAFIILIMQIINCLSSDRKQLMDMETIDEKERFAMEMNWYLETKQFRIEISNSKNTGFFLGYDKPIKSKITIDIEIEKHPMAEKIFFHDLKEIEHTDGFHNAYTRIKKFEVSWNGKQIKVPKALYEDCFLLNLQSGSYPLPDSKYIPTWAVVNEKEESILIKSSSFGEGERYVVYWIINRNGVCQRFIDSSVP
ncbi:MAG: hypothetical protein NZM04_03990 [Methylacidiphilales bacterium]|nr:hypothetical protein [Candidatus Methylacidiphilales bacterium]